MTSKSEKAEKFKRGSDSIFAQGPSGKQGRFANATETVFNVGTALKDAGIEMGKVVKFMEKESKSQAA